LAAAARAIARPVADSPVKVIRSTARFSVSAAPTDSGEPVQQRAPLGVTHTRPRAVVEGAARRSDGAVGLLRPAERHVGIAGSRPRVDGLEPRTRRGLDLLAVDDVWDQCHAYP
jgi:hypothetical protein